MYKSNKKDLFWLWKRNNKDLNKVLLIVRRKAAKETLGKGKKSMVKVRDLVGKGMPEKKAKDLRDRKMQKGEACYDPEFPDDQEEIMFWLTTEISFENTNRTEEIRGQ